MGFIVENQVIERSTSFYILRFVKISRIIFFGSIIGVQAYFALTAVSVNFLPSITAASFMIIMDLIMFNRRKDDFKEFYLVSLIICLSALVITIMIFFPLLLFLYISNAYVALFYLFGLGVMIVSLIELITLIYLTRPQENYEEKVWETKDDVWESEKDTIDIQ